MLIIFFATLILGLFFTNFLINFLYQKKIQQSIREEGPKHHFVKSGTPTMGGLAIIITTLIILLLNKNLINHYVLLLTFLLVGFGLIGVIDDYLISVKRSNKGLKGYQKLSAQIFLALIFAGILTSLNHYEGTSGLLSSLGFTNKWFYAGLIAFIIVGASNAVNLTDGLDGLAGGTSIITLIGLLWITHTSSNPQFYYIEIFLIILIAAILAFLWFNINPAKIFMGDTGSLSIGAVIGAVAILIHKELLLIILGGIFVIETLSVIIQVFSFKVFGKRVFKMSPFHHHLELHGLTEINIVIKFWIIQILLVVIALNL